MGGANAAPPITPTWSRARSIVRSALQRRVVTRVDGLREKPFLVVGPELAHVRIGLDRRVDELVALSLAFPDEEVADDVAEVVEVERTTRRVGEPHGAQRFDE